MGTRLRPEFHTGGTFGVNMYQADDRLFSFNYRLVSTEDATRREQHEHVIQHLDSVHGFQAHWQRNSPREPAPLEWLERFQSDKWPAARDFWQELNAGWAEAFEQGPPEPKPV